MKYLKVSTGIFALLGMAVMCCLAWPVCAVAQRGESELDSSPPQGITEQEIIQKLRRQGERIQDGA